MGNIENHSAVKPQRRSEKKTIAASIFVIVFFVTLIIVYFMQLHSARRESIINRSELSAVETAQQFELYLTSSRDSLKLAGYTVDNLVRENRPDEEIQEYLEKESARCKRAIDKNYTWLYGWINGKYYDGENWQPPEGFVATERPWYKAAMEKPGELVLVDPYTDIETDKKMMTIAQTLSDGKSVIALDMELDRIQEITAEATANNSAMAQMVLDSRSVVVAHSDKNELGRDYRYADGTVGYEVMKKLENGHDDQEEYFQMRFGGDEYIIYCVRIDSDWYSISVIDATKVFMPLRIMLISTVGAVLITIVILTMVFVNAIRKSRIAEKLNVQMSTVANIYMSMHDIDVKANTFSEIITTGRETDELPRGKVPDAQHEMYKIIDELVHANSLEAMRRFIDFHTLDERLSSTNTVTEEFLSRDDLWCRGRFIVSERTMDGNVSHVLWLVESIDEEKRRRDELWDMSVRAVAANEAKSSFLSSMSHEIRTPINAVLGMNEMVLRESRDPNITAYSESIRNAGNTLLGLINDILDFSKIEAGKMDIIPVDYDLASVLNDVVTMIQPRADAKNLTLRPDCDPGIPRLLHGDEIRIKQIIMNLLTNAVKYTEHGTVSLTLRYERLLGDPNGSIVLKVCVSDTGIGIRKEDMPKLLTAFERVDEQRNRSIEGTGLGLHITQRMLNMMSSKLEIHSVYGKGSEFGFSLRQKVVRWEPVGDFEKAYRKSAAQRHEYTESFTAPEAKVLVTDDVQMNLEVFASLLKQTKVKIDTAISGSECISKALTEKYDMIFLDHMMPRKDGIQTLKELRAVKKCPNAKTPVICLTANAISGARDTYLDAGFDDYLTKPIDSAKLEEMMIKYLPKDKVERGTESGGNEKKPETELPEFLKGIAELDTDEGLKLCGSADVYIEMLITYRNMIDGNIAEIESLRKSNNIKDFTIKVHALKSNLRMIGATQAGELAYQLEQAGNKKDIVFIDRNLLRLLERSRKIGRKLAPLEKTVKDSAERSAVSDEQLAEVYSELRAAALAFDFDGVTRTIEKLAGFALPEKEKQRFEKLKEAADSIDYDTIPAILDE